MSELNQSSENLHNSSDTNRIGTTGERGAYTTPPDAVNTGDGRRPAALITGGALRIGASVARYLCSVGYDILIHYNRSDREALLLRDELMANGAQSEVFKADLTSDEQITHMLSSAWNFAGNIDLIVNNASIFSKELLSNADASLFERHWRINALAPVLITREYASLLTECNYFSSSSLTGSVVNMLDRRVATNEPECLAYLCSKKYLAAFTESAAIEMAPSIRINAVAPGAVLPPSGENSSENSGYAPLDAHCSPLDVAKAVHFLAVSGGITGQIVYVDSGQHLESIST